MAYGQLISDYPLDAFLNFTVNPAHTAEQESITFGVQHARKWHNLKSSPVQSNAAILLPFKNERMGFGAQIFSDNISAFSTTGLGLSYGYKFPVGITDADYLSIGLSAHIMHVKFDRNHLVVVDESDALLTDIEGNKIVPPAFAAGFHYTTGTPHNYQPFQWRTGFSVSRFLPFQNRFNTLAFDRQFQWYGTAGMSIWLGYDFTLAPDLIIYNAENGLVNFGVRVKTDYEPVGWVMLQYAKAGFFTTQIGFHVSPQQAADRFMISASNNWYFGTLNNQLGHSLNFSITYMKAIRKRY